MQFVAERLVAREGMAEQHVCVALAARLHLAEMGSQVTPFPTSSMVVRGCWPRCVVFVVLTEMLAGWRPVFMAFNRVVVGGNQWPRTAF